MENKKRILIIEDDESIASIEKDFLELSNFDVEIAYDGESGLKALSTNTYDLIILDIMLPKISGYDVLKRIRVDIDIPVLMVTAKAEEIDTIRGLGLGADDYITKPFSPSELVARVKANIAQYERLKKVDDKEEYLRSKDLLIHKPSHRVYINDKEIYLKNREYEVLVYLMEHKDVVLSKEQIYDKIWDMDAFGDLKTVPVHINRLRQKIEKNPENPQYIETVWGAGYRFKG